jgi:hypothetical protein
VIIGAYPQASDTEKVSDPLASIKQMLMGVFEIRRDVQRLGARWLLICDLVGGFVGAVIAVAVLLTVVS